LKQGREHMPINSIIRETLGIKDHRVEGIRREKGALVVELERHMGRLLPCSRCGTRSRVRDRLAVRRWRHVPLWGIPVFLEYAPARVRCGECGKVVVEAIPWSRGKSPLSLGLIDLLSTWAKLLAWNVVAGLFRVHWNTVAGAVRQAVEYGLEHRELGGVLYIGVDELSRRKGHVYVTNVYDLSEGRLLWSGEGRGTDTLEAFFEEHGEALKDQVIGACCDMWEPYVEVLRKYLPDATLVFDKFHIVRNLLTAVDEVRREEAKELKAKNPEILKRTRYIWLKNPENLTDKQKARLGYLEKLNLRSNRAYLLKETFRELWNYTTKWGARRFLKKWFWWATHSRLKPMRDFAWLLRRHEEEILNYFELPIDNGAVEGLNNKAKVVSHRCYGFRTAKTYITALYHVLGKLPEPPMVHRFL
jgi:transposase